MDLLVPVGLLAVSDAGAGGGHLEVAALEDFTVAHRVLAVDKSVAEARGKCTKGDVLLELASDDVRKDLELPVGVRAEAGARCDTVLVDDAQRTKVHVRWIFVPISFHTSEHTINGWKERM